MTETLVTSLPTDEQFVLREWDSLGTFQADQKQRWSKGERIAVEAYASASPLVGQNDQVRLALIVSEFHLRLERGEDITIAGYQDRFPELAGSIEALLELEDESAGGSQIEIDGHTGEGSTAIGFESPNNTVDLTGLPKTKKAVDPTLPAKTQSASVNESAQFDGYKKEFGDYELLGEIARGGMGVVFKARQVSLDRIVAIKMILAGELAGDNEEQRFKSEAEAAARLDHPGIVPIYEVGQIDGQSYFSMGYISGPSLAELVEKDPLPSREAALLLKSISEAIAYAHSCNVIHRDLKPANILLAPADGTVSENSESNRFAPKVTDFGLAKRIEDDQGLTATGQILGTPGYMPPEQAAGKVDEISEASDIYSLGAILYCMLTGRPPFVCGNVVNTLLEVIDKEPVPPRLLNSYVDRDLELICLACLEKDPSRRYSSAETLVQDIDAYLCGDSISVSGNSFVGGLARVLNRSRYDAAFASWGAMLLWFALIVMAAEVATFFQSFRSEFVPLAHALPIRVVQFLVMGAIACGYRKEWVSSGAVERQMWATWVGFVVACHLVVFVCWIMLPESTPFHYFGCYPFFAMLSGVLFFMYGGSHWGICFVFGSLFFLLSAVMPLHLQLAPLEFGAVWGVSLITIGYRLKSMASRDPNTGAKRAHSK